MTNSALRHNQAAECSSQVPAMSEADIDRVLSRLREVEVPIGLKDRVEARLNAAESADRGAAAPYWSRVRLAASILVVGFASISLVVYRATGVRAVAHAPAMYRRAPSSGLGAAGAIRVPTRAMETRDIEPGSIQPRKTESGNTESGNIEPRRLGEGRASHLPRSGRQTIARHTVLPHGVAVPNHPVDGYASTSEVADQ